MPSAVRAGQPRLQQAGAPWVRSPVSWNTRAKLPPRRPVAERVNDWFEIYQRLSRREASATQGARCMDCGVPFCHTGCPVNNIIPDWNDLVYRGRWQEAIRSLHATNNSRSSPAASAPRPAKRRACSGINEPPVTIKHDREDHRRARLRGRLDSARAARSAHRQDASRSSAPDPRDWPRRSNWRAPATRSPSSKRPTASADCCATAFPNFKMEKHLIDRRLEQMRAEGVEFRDQRARRRAMSRSKICAATSTPSCWPAAPSSRAICKVPGRELKGIHFAMEFLPQQNKRCEGDTRRPATDILATGKRVVIIGGGDTGADCLGTSPPPEAALRAPVRNHAQAAGRARAVTRPGRCGRCSCASKARTKKAASATGASPPLEFTGDEHGNVKQLHAHPRRPAAEVRADPGHASSRWMPIWCCSPWASSARCATA